MTDREKLVKLIQSAVDGCAEYWAGLITDHLIANGVTFATGKNDGRKKTSKQKTKDILDWVQSMAEVDWGFMCCLKQELEQLVAIASRDDAFGGKWIPVTERLPGCEDVLVVVKSKYDFESQYTIDVDVAAHRFDGGYIDNRWDTFNDWDEGQQYLHVTHWMPLPTPPKGE